MSCSICNSSPCICGDDYYKLTDDGFLNLLSKMQKIAKDRGIDAKVLVNEVDVDKYIEGKDIKISNDKGFLSILKTFTHIPDQYLTLLEIRKGKNLIQVYQELSECDIPIFPLKFAIAKFLNVNKKQLRLCLINIFYDHIMNFEYPVPDELAAISQAELMKLCMANDSDFNYALYRQQMSYKRYAEQLNKAVKQHLEKTFLDYAEIYCQSMDLIRSIMSDDATGVINDLFYYMLLVGVTSIDERNFAKKKYNEKGITQDITDNLYSCDYAFCQELEKVNIRIPAELKV